jgi:hypothetical protein
MMLINLAHIRSITEISICTVQVVFSNGDTLVCSEYFWAIFKILAHAPGQHVPGVPYKLLRLNETLCLVERLK